MYKHSEKQQKQQNIQRQVSAKLRSDIAGDTGRKKCKRENAV